MSHFTNIDLKQKQEVTILVDDFLAFYYVTVMNRRFLIRSGDNQNLVIPNNKTIEH